jgi:hypothetical protein
VNDFRRAQLKVLFALLVEYHESNSNFSDLDDLNRDYSMQIPEEWLHSTVSDWERRDIVTVARTLDGSTSARIKRSEYGQALTEVMEWLSSESLSINARTMEIVADINPPADIPLRKGWKWMSFNNDKKPATPSAVDSATWTGRYSVSKEGADHIRLIIRQIDEKIDSSDLPNSDKTNAKALLEASEKLIDAPDPQWGLIVQILSSPILANFAALAAIAISIIKP